MPTLRGTIKDIADALREKGVSETMSLLEMPEKAEEIKSAKYGIGMGVWFGDLDQNGCLQEPSGSYVLYSPYIKEIAGNGGNAPLYYTFIGCDTLVGVELPNLETIHLAGMSLAFKNSGVRYARFPKLVDV